VTIRYTGLIAPEETPTGDSRLFKAAGGTTRPLPITVMAKFSSGGHVGATIVGNLTSWYDGPGGKWGSIGFMDPTIVPEVIKTCYMLDKKALGPSVDLDQDYTVQAIAHPKIANKKAAYFTSYNVVGVTLVPMPAFAEVHLSADTSEEKALLASAGIDFHEVTHFDINTRAWDAWPIAPRNYVFNADDAVKRIAAWSGIGTKTPSLEHYASAFLWRDGNQVGDSLAQDSFRLPLADIIQGQPHLIYHAVYAAAALLSGGHGGLPNIPEADQGRMKIVINDIYAKMAQVFGDQGMKSPFDPNIHASLSVDDDCDCTETEDEFAVPAVRPYGNVTYADPGYQSDKKARYPVDNEQHVRAAWSYISHEANASKYTAVQLQSIKDKIMAAAKKLGINIAAATDKHPMAGMPPKMSLLASVAPVAPPRAWFEQSAVSGPVPFSIGKNGQVFGHLALWRKCHIGIGNACVMAPRSKTDYSYFTMGPVTCDDGSEVRVGVISFGSAHANERYGVMPAREFYDNSSKAGAVVKIYEDKFGIFVAGSLTAGLSDVEIAEIKRSQLSGDWRLIEGNLELIAALAVNTPGFPVIRQENGSMFCMQGIGVVEFDGEAEVVTEIEEPVPSEDFTSRLADVHAKRLASKAKSNASRLAGVGAQREQLAQSSQSTILARQYDAKFEVVAE